MKEDRLSSYITTQERETERVTGTKAEGTKRQHQPDDAGATDSTVFILNPFDSDRRCFPMHERDESAMSIVEE